MPFNNVTYSVWNDLKSTHSVALAVEDKLGSCYGSCTELVEYFGTQMRKDPDMASAVAAIRTLLEFLKRDTGLSEPILAQYCVSYVTLARMMTHDHHNYNGNVGPSAFQGRRSSAWGRVWPGLRTVWRGRTPRWPCLRRGSSSCGSSASRPWSTRYVVHATVLWYDIQ